MKNVNVYAMTGRSKILIENKKFIVARECEPSLWNIKVWSTKTKNISLRGIVERGVI